MLFMVVETFKSPDLIEVRNRFQTEGRLMPEGVSYVASWMSSDGRQCFQVNQADSRNLLDEWITNWNDLVDFEVYDVVDSSEFWNHRDLSK
jgi:hypothetical protein